MPPAFLGLQLSDSRPWDFSVCMMCEPIACNKSPFIYIYNFILYYLIFYMYKYLHIYITYKVVCVCIYICILLILFLWRSLTNTIIFHIWGDRSTSSNSQATLERKSFLDKDGTRVLGGGWWTVFQPDTWSSKKPQLLSLLLIPGRSHAWG